MRWHRLMLKIAREVCFNWQYADGFGTRWWAVRVSKNIRGPRALDLYLEVKLQLMLSNA